MTTTLRVPASSANLGPGFDALGLALSLYLDFSFAIDPSRVMGEPCSTTDEHHLAVRTFRGAGGVGPAHVAANFAGGRGMGFSGAARVAGVLAARLQHGDPWQTARTHAFIEGSRLEGHADNVGASVMGGLVAVANAPHGDPHVVRVPIALDIGVVVWVPQTETSTKSSRTLLPDVVPFGDAVFNIGRSALLDAALGAGDIDALRVACDDRLHQDRRFERVPDSRAARDAFLQHGAWCSWLSGSGPAVAALCDPAMAPNFAQHLPKTGRTVVCAIDTEGTRYL